MMADQDIEKTNTVDNKHPESSSVIAHHPQGHPIARDNPNELYPHLLEIASGTDVWRSVVDYAHQLGRAICLLGGNGLFAEVTLRLSTGIVGTFWGIFQIISISGKILPPSAQVNSEELTVCLLDTKGQLVMGEVIPPLVVAFGPMKLSIVSFSNIGYESLP